MHKEESTFSYTAMKDTWRTLKHSKKGYLRLGRVDSPGAIEAAKKHVTLAGLKGRSFIFGLTIARMMLRRHVSRLGREERGQSNALDALKDDIKNHQIREIMNDQADFHAHTRAAASEDYNLLLDVYMAVGIELAHLHDFLKKNPTLQNTPEAKKFFDKFSNRTFETLQNHQKMLNDLVAETEGHAGLNLGLKIANLTSTQTGGFLDVFAQRRRFRGAIKDVQALDKLEKKGVATQEQLKVLEKALDESLADIDKLVEQLLRDWRSQLKLLNEDYQVMEKAKEEHEVPGGFAEEERNHRALLGQLLLAYFHSLEMCVNQLAAQIRKV
ncbi:hypothetical protein HY772_01760 [Candidatus Woesearchaeota archaeon]|nr:hypothetical protein [Candidatus Woesearchaeota archaeon]